MTLLDDITNAIKQIDQSIKISADRICYVNKSNLKAVLSELKQTWRFTMLTDLFGADFPDREKRFEVVYNLLSFKHNLRIIVKIEIADKEDACSVTDIFSVANWYEREIFDMFGINFSNHPQLERILTDYGFEGHPLRKDFPLSGYKQVRYDKDLEQVIYEPVDLEQNFRNFDFSSQWQGPNYILPGDEKASKASK